MTQKQRRQAQLDQIVTNVERAIAAYKQGRMVIIVDDADRENEGDFTMPAENITPEAINFMAHHGRGLICVPMDGSYVERLELPMMVTNNNAPMFTAFTVSVDAKEGISTGISANDRAHTVRMIADPSTTRDDFVAPGHIFPLRYHEGGVLVRAGQTEGSVDLAILAGKRPVTVICEIMNEDGSMARYPNLKKISSEHDIPILSIADLVAYRMRTDRCIEQIARAKLPTIHGEFTVQIYRNTLNGDEHLAIHKGDLSTGEPLVRVHSQCLTSDVFGSIRCDCGEQLNLALERIAANQAGAVVYLRQEGRGIGLADKIKAYHIQDDQQVDTVEANAKLGYAPDLRDYGVGAQILRDIGVRRFRLLTNNPRKVIGIQGFGLELTGIEPIPTKPRPENSGYLETKATKLGHSTDLQELIS